MANATTETRAIGYIKIPPSLKNFAAADILPILEGKPVEHSSA